MPRFGELLQRLRGIFGGGRTDADIEAELRAHLEFAAEEEARAGLPVADASRVARLRSGGLTQAVEAARRQRGFSWPDELARDVVFGLRALRRTPGFTIVALVTLALGIGLNAAMFGIVDRLILRGPDHVHEPERLGRLQRSAQPPGRETERTGYFGYVTYDSLRQHASLIEGVAAYSTQDAVLGQGETARRIVRGQATASLFPLLGVAPVLGRFYSAHEDDVVTPEAVAVIGYGLWQTEFGGQHDALGSTVVINDQTYTVIGVAPRGFTGADLGRVDVWLPESLIGRGVVSPNWTGSWNASWLNLLVRLKPSVTPDRAAAELTAIHRAVYTGTDDVKRQSTLAVLPIRFGSNGEEPLESRVAVWLLAVSGIVLLVSCTNVVNLLLARGLSRQRELAVRLALGAPRGRIVRLLLVEVGLLVAAGTAIGFAIAHGIATLVRTWLIPDVSWTSAPIDGRVALVGTLVAAVVGAATGILPALRASSPRLAAALRTGVRDGGGHRSRARGALTIAQAALSTVLLVGAGLFVGSLGRAQSVDLGLETDRVLAFNVRRASLPEGLDADARATEQARRRTFYQAALAEIAALPDVDAASLTVGLAFNSTFSQDIRVPDVPRLPELPGGGPFLNAVTADYFRTTGTRILKGRSFTTADRAGSAPVAIVNETMASALWPNGDAMGKCFYVDDSPACRTIVGIAADSKRFTLRDEAALGFYVPYGQEVNIGGTSLLVRPRGDRARAMAAVRARLLELDPSITYVDASLLQDRIDPLVRPWRLGATMFTFMGVLALVIAAFGLYSVMSYLVVQRRHEIGVRIALGASPANMAGLFARGGLALAVSGVVIGLAFALLAAPLVAPLLFDTSPRDPRVFAAAAAVLLLVAGAATLVPALRARRVNPLEAMRAE